MSASPTAPPPPPASALERWALPAAGLATLALLLVAVFAHPTPLYRVETDLVGEYIPAAQALLAGRLDPGHYAFKGPGYPLLLALATAACGGDAFLGARVLSVLAAGLSIWLAFVIVRRLGGVALGLFALAALALDPALVLAAIEAGTDAPALALALAALAGALGGGGRGRLFAAGLAAGFAIVTRYNMAFLVPAGLVAIAAGRGAGERGARAAAGRAATFLAGAVLPLGIWMAINSRLTGHPLASNNYLNVAFELYGRDLPWDRFEAEIGSRFRSLADVLAFDPAHAARRIAANLALHRLLDLHRLVPVWIGVLAVPGLALLASRRQWRPALVAALLAALAVAPVFYAERFVLVLAPFYVAAAGAALGAAGRRAARRWGASRARRLTVAAAGLLVAASGAAAAAGAGRLLAEAPHETREAGRQLAARGLAGQAILARKPHVAHFAGMAHRPMGYAGTVPDLMAQARAAGARYVFYSPIELTQRPEYGVLADSGLRLPGLEPVLYRRLAGERFYAVYRVDPSAPDSAALVAALERALVRSLERRPDEPAARVFAAVQLARLGRPREVVAALEPLVRRGARDRAVATLLGQAYAELGEDARALVHLDEALRIGPPTAALHGRRAEVHARAGRWERALEDAHRAVDLEPGQPSGWTRLGLLHVERRDYRPAARAFERGLRLAPLDPLLRRYAIAALDLAGDRPAAARLLAEGLAAGVPAAALLENAP